MGGNHQATIFHSWMFRAPGIAGLFFSFPVESTAKFQMKFNQTNCQADQIDAANLVRVYGALLWNVGKARVGVEKQQRDGKQNRRTF